MTGIGHVSRPEPPSEPPEDTLTRWNWYRQTHYYAIRASEDVAKVLRMLSDFRAEYTAHVGESTRDEKDIDKRFAEFATDLETLRDEMEEKLLKPLSEIQVQRNKLDGMKIIIIAVGAVVVQLLVGLVSKKLGI